MKPFFTPEDFYNAGYEAVHSPIVRKSGDEYFADMANAKVAPLQERLQQFESGYAGLEQREHVRLKAENEKLKARWEGPWNCTYDNGILRVEGRKIVDHSGLHKRNAELFDLLREARVWLERCNPAGDLAHQVLGDFLVDIDKALGEGEQT